MVWPLVSIASDPVRLDLAERLHDPMLQRTSLFLRSGISTSPANPHEPREFREFRENLDNKSA
jgi:hypothetical protein